MGDVNNSDNHSSKWSTLDLNLGLGTERKNYMIVWKQNSVSLQLDLQVDLQLVCNHVSTQVLVEFAFTNDSSDIWHLPLLCVKTMRKLQDTDLVPIPVLPSNVLLLIITKSPLLLWFMLYIYWDSSSVSILYKEHKAQLYATSHLFITLILLTFIKPITN